jgi:hypothetical protein
MENFKENFEKLIIERIEKLRVERNMSYNNSIIKEVERKIDLLIKLREALFGF